MFYYDWEKKINFIIYNMFWFLFKRLIAFLIRFLNVVFLKVDNFHSNLIRIILDFQKNFEFSNSKN